MTVRRINSPQNITVDHVHKAGTTGKFIKFADYDENYLVFVVIPRIKANNHEIQVMSTSNYQLIRSQKFTGSCGDDRKISFGYGRGLIVKVNSMGNSMRY